MNRNITNAMRTLFKYMATMRKGCGKTMQNNKRTRLPREPLFFLSRWTHRRKNGTSMNNNAKSRKSIEKQKNGNETIRNQRE